MTDTLAALLLVLVGAFIFYPEEIGKLLAKANHAYTVERARLAEPKKPEWKNND